MTDLNKEREALVAQIEEFKKDAMELWFVPDLAESYKSMDMFSYSIVENNEVFFMREQARQLWSFWNKAKAQAVPEWISAEVGRPIKFGTRVKIKRKAWDEDDNLIIVESEATYDKDSDFCELSNRSYEYETWFDHELKKYLDEDELTHWAPLDKSESGA
ncbi:DUF551 domain-containing protein, partial [Acinetobacter baumannii]|uniref:DUF551 domain-containing protein n=1 Tax=Acinetobacter baumannii TaxID=470 RepID=UPI001D180832